MKLCFLAQANSNHTKRWVEYFAKEHEIDLITLSYTKKEDTFVPEEVYKKMNVRVHKVSKPMPFLLFAPFKIRRLIKKIKPDIVHAHYVTQYGFCGAFSGFHPLIVSPWGSDIAVDPDKSIWKRWLVEYALQRADVVSSVEGPFKRRLIDLKCSKNKIVSIPVASVNTNEFHPSKRSEALRKAMGAKNSFLVLNARPLTPLYHVDVFIHAIPLVVEKIPNVKFIILYGKGQMKHQLEELAQKLNVEDNILWMRRVPHSKMPEYLASVDLYIDTFVSFLHTEAKDKCPGIGTTTLEAMSCAIPTIVSNKYRKRIYPLKDCPYIPYYPLDSQDLADKIIELLQNEKLIEQIKQESRDFVMLKVDENRAMKKWEDLYQMLKR